jgi:tellurite resistance protein TehA-like permease
MGTGIVAILLYEIPFYSPVTYYLSIVFFILNVILFTAALFISILRYTIWPEIGLVMILDPLNSLFISAVPMGFATLINMWLLVCVPVWGEWAKTAAVAAWILDAVASVITTIALPSMLMCRDDIKTLDRINAAQLLPIAATVVAAGIGSKTAAVLENPVVVERILITCYVMWGLSIPFAFIIFVLYYHRLVLHKLPPREVIVSAFLPLGPCGYSSTILIILGKVARDNFPKTGTLDPLAGQIAYVVGFFVGLVIWGFGLLWFCFALVGLYRSKPIPFNMGWWGFTFPLGVYAAATLQIGGALDSKFFNVLGTVSTA